MFVFNKGYPLIQVIEELPDGKIRTYQLEDAHIGDKNDPLTTIRIKVSEYADSGTKLKPQNQGYIVLD